MDMNFSIIFPSVLQLLICFGSINNKNIILGQGTSIYLSKNNNTFFNNLYLDYGLQYYGSINKHWDFTIGAIYANQTNLNTETNVNVINLDSNVLRTKTTSALILFRQVTDSVFHLQGIRNTHCWLIINFKTGRAFGLQPEIFFTKTVSALL